MLTCQIALPWPRNVSGGDRRRPHFVALGPWDGSYLHQQLGAVLAEIDADDGGIGQRRTVASVIGGLKAAGQKKRKLVPAVVLDVVLQPAAGARSVGQAGDDDSTGACELLR